MEIVSDGVGTMYAEQISELTTARKCLSNGPVAYQEEPEEDKAEAKKDLISRSLVIIIINIVGRGEKKIQ